MTISEPTRLGGKGEALPGADTGNATQDRQTPEPIIVSEFQRNTRETIRVCLSRYRSGATVDIRDWYPAGGQMRPSRSGIALGVAHLHKLEAAIKAAIELAKAEGLLGIGKGGR